MIDWNIEGHKNLNSLEELDSAINHADQMAKISDEAMRKHLSRFSYNMLDASAWAGNPFSSEYTSKVIEEYERISGRSRSLDNEHTDFDFDSAVVKPFPFSTKSPVVVADHFIQIAHLIRILGLSEGVVADLGPGWGNTTEMLARLGLEVWAVDINKDFIELIKTRAKSNGLNIRTITGDFSAVKATPELDGAVFFESFHHCLEHIDLLNILRRKMKDGGVIAFAGEPIVRGYFAPWFLRPDGMSVWSIRKFGWLELGFDEDYFLEILLRTGWAPSRVDLHGFLPGYRAVKTDTIYPASVSWPSTSNWAEAETNPNLTLRFTTEHTFIPTRMGRSQITVRNFRQRPLTIKICDLQINLSPNEQRAVQVDHKHKIDIRAETWCPANELMNDDHRTLGVAVENIINI